MQNLKIYITGSAELIPDIQETQKFINQHNKILASKGFFLELYSWERHAYLSVEYKVDNIIENDIESSDIFVLLVHSKLGLFSIDEFNFAKEKSQKNGNPRILIFFKESPIDVNEIDLDDYQRVVEFRKELDKIGFFYNRYKTQKELKLHFIKQLDRIVEQKSNNLPSKRSLSVFVSYNHKDTVKAQEIKDRIESEGFGVVIDSESMYPGADIEEFISNSILNTNITLSIVSKNSLLSSWVGLESIESFNKETKESRKFLPVILENSFFERNFTGDALDSIDLELIEIVDILKKRLEKRTGFADLYGEFKRYLALRNNIDEIVRRLRESLSIDISGESYEQGINRIIDYLLELNEKGNEA